MKILIGLVATLASLAAYSATWTFHGVKDNWSMVYLWSLSAGETSGWPRSCTVQWDWNWDVLNPDQVDSGVSFWIGTNGEQSPWTGYSDSVTLNLDGNWYIEGIGLGGPAPDYNGYWSSFDEYDLGGPGEYWLDFDAYGSFRWSTVTPSDFGKWAWDGSVNPSWVEPLAKKGHGKGHAK